MKISEIKSHENLENEFSMKMKNSKFVDGYEKGNNEFSNFTMDTKDEEQVDLKE